MGIKISLNKLIGYIFKILNHTIVRLYFFALYFAIII